MRKLLLLFVTVTAGVFTLAWINFRRENEPPARGPRHAGPDDSGPDETSAEDVGAAEAGSNGSTEPARCAATTSGGKRCTREVLEGSRFCWQHG